MEPTLLLAYPANANPVVLDAEGRVQRELGFLGDASFATISPSKKYVITSEKECVCRYDFLTGELALPAVPAPKVKTDRKSRR